MPLASLAADRSISNTFLSGLGAVMKADPNQPDKKVTIEQLIDSMVIDRWPQTVTERLLSFRERTGPYGGLLTAMMDGSGTNRAREFESTTLLAREVMTAVRSAIGR